MSSTTKSVSYEVTAVATGFVKGMEDAATAATTASAQIDAQFKKLGDSFSAVQKALMGFTAVLAGGGALKSLITDANAWNGEAAKMAKQLGITTESASVLNVALNHIGVDSATYITASEKLSKNVQGNAQAFKVLGVQVQEASGQYRPVVDVMAEVNQKLAAIKNPIEQNIAGQQIYGKGWSEVRGILKLTVASMAEADARARELGLIVGPEGAAMSRKYTEQMRDLNLVGKAMEVQFGNALLPVFTNLGSVMSKELPQAANVFATVLGTVMETLTVLAANMAFVFGGIGREIGAVAAQAGLLFQPSTWGKGQFTAISDEVKADGVRARAELDALEKKIMGLSVTAPGAPKAASPDAPAPHYKFKEKKEGDPDKGDTAKWDAELAEQKLAFAEKKNIEGSFQEFSKQSEAQFWRSKLDLTTAGTADNLTVRKKIAETELSLNKGRFAATLETLKAEEAASASGSNTRIEVLNQEARLIKDRYGEESKEYQAAQKAIIEARRQAADQLKQIDDIRVMARHQASLAEIQLEETNAQLQKDLGVITTQQELALEQQYEQRRYEISKEGLNEREALAAVDPERNAVELARIHAELEALEQQHQKKMADIKRAVQKDEFGPLQAIYSAAQTSIANAITGILNRTMTLKQGLASAWKGISQSVISEIAAMLAKQIAAFAVTKALAIAGIGTDAAKAGSGAASSVANIPYVGPVLAIAALAAVFAAVSGMKSNVPSAAGGFDIPMGLNPLTQLHEQEMVLPAKHADVIRRMADSAAGAGGPEQHTHINLTVNAMDAPGVKRLLLDNQDAFAATLVAARRNGHLAGKF
jgi:hypothetical protein